MKRILLLGGIGEALTLAQRLAIRHQVVYSLAGRARVPELPCQVRTGGFGGVEGLVEWLLRSRCELLIDATHPYAVRISEHGAVAAQRAGLKIWAYRRPPWRPSPGDDWREVADWRELAAILENYRRPFFTMGLEPLLHTRSMPVRQHWLVRVIDAPVPVVQGVTLVRAVGPFGLDAELDTLRSHRIDVVVTKNSGGAAVAAKLDAARMLGIPVVMWRRPELPVVAPTFTTVQALAEWLGS